MVIYYYLLPRTFTVARFNLDPVIPECGGREQVYAYLGGKVGYVFTGLPI